MLQILVECTLTLNLTQERHYRAPQESINSLLKDGVGFNIIAANLVVVK